MFYALGALAAPIIIHLWHKRRVIQVHFSTLRFLKLAAAKSSRSSRLENIVLLLLRCLVLILLIFAAARPVIPSKSARLFGGELSRTIVLGIDHSMSMNVRIDGQSRLEAAKKMALAVIDSLNPGDSIAVMAIGDQATPLIAKPTVDHRVARQIIESIQSSETRSNFPAAFHEAAKMVENEVHGPREFYLFTDNQENAWHFDLGKNDSWKDSEFQTTIVLPDDQTPSNATVREVKIKTPFVTTGASVSGVAVIENFSARPLQDLLEIKVSEERVAQKPIELGPWASIEIPFEFQVQRVTGRCIQGIASLEGDNLPDDDSFYFSIPVYQEPRVLIIEGQTNGEERLHSGYFLKKALSLGNSTPPKCISFNQLDDTALENFSALFLTDIPKLSDKSLLRINRFLKGGGTVVFFPGDLTNPAQFPRLDFLPIQSKGIRDLPPGRLATQINEPGHPLLGNTWDSGTPFPALPQKKRIDWSVGSTAKALITFSDNVPFLILGNHESGRVILINASADRAWGDFPLSPAFLPLVQQIAKFSAEPDAGGANITLGDEIPYSSRLPQNETLTVKYPDHTLHPLSAGDRTELVHSTEQNGFYEVSSAITGVLQIFAVNADRRESNLNPIDPIALSKILPAETVIGLENLRLRLEKSHGMVPLWPLFLGLTLIVFAMEGVLSNLMARHRSQGEIEPIKTGRLNKRRIGVTFRPADRGSAL